ncbi:MAG TPA: helix-turn-helix domain-containing protein [Roseiflexaceae bacterium]|nr:helix-turn-helix domain-containing protein [Roseiflexaceae bacterium]
MTANMDDEWISLQNASELLGVAASTLRRWGDAGRLPMKRTLGGHRRFSRAAVAQMAAYAAPLPLAPQPPVPIGGWGVDERDLARQEWHARLAARPGADRMRGLGQRLLGLLMQHINRRPDDDRYLAEARAVGAHYGREARAAGASMHDTVEAFLFFRRTFAQLAIPPPGIAHPPDLAAAAELHGRIDRFMDAILLGTIAGYEEALQGELGSARRGPA